MNMTLDLELTILLGRDRQGLDATLKYNQLWLGKDYYKKCGIS